MKTIEIIDTFKTIGKVEILVDGSPVVSKHNDMLAGMGYALCYALRTGTAWPITGMYGHQTGGASRTEFSVPTLTSGGTGAEDNLIVQSTWTNTTGGGVTFDEFWVTVEPFDVSQDYLDIANVNNDSVVIAAAGTLTINWTIQIPSTTCAFEADQRYQLAKALAPGSTTIYYEEYGVFEWAGGDSGHQVFFATSGGTGYDQQLIFDCRYTHAAPIETVTDVKFYNDNGDLIRSRTSLNVAVDNGETLQSLHTIKGLGTVQGGGGPDLT